MNPGFCPLQVDHQGGWFIRVIPILIPCLISHQVAYRPGKSIRRWVWLQIFTRRGKPQVLVYVSTYQGSILVPVC